MSDSDNKKPTLARKPLGVKRTVDAGQVQQSFSHGRKNTVVVEVKRRRMIGKPGEAPPAPAPAPEPTPEPVAKAPAPAPTPAPAPRRQSEADATLTRKELQEKLLREAEESRLNQLEEARRREDRERSSAVDEEKRRAEENRKAEESQQQAEAAAEANPQVEVRAEPDISGDDSKPAEPAGDKFPPARKFTPVESKRPEPKRAERPAKDRNERRQSGKLTVTRALEGGDGGARARSLAALKRAREKEKRSHMGPRVAQPKQTREVVVPEAITVQELSKRMGEKGADLVKTLFKMDMMVTVNQTIDADTAELLVEEFGHIVKRVSEADVEIDTNKDVDPEETLKPRAPVVTIMGHVDHGKTSLLDALRGTDVVAGEAGGITQHIGAYKVTTKDGAEITFLDTPGHEAFTEMRARGANVTDIVILVVAADDGLMPQTIEAINHTKAAGVPMIVAINKIDKDGANPQKIRERLLEHEVIVEAMSGDVQDVEVSALKKLNLDKLLDAIALQAELLELKANPDRAAEGTVVEAKLDKGRGPVATILVNRGTLKVGDVFVVGTESGKVRALIDDKGKQVKTAGPASPVEVLGLSGVPSAGETLSVVENEARAREVASYRQEQATSRRTAIAPANLDTMFSALADKAKVIEYPVVVKADVQGSVEAIVNALNKISTDDIKVRVLHSGVGAITESDVTLASASNAPIIGFNVRPNPKARQLVAREKTRLKYFDVIYDLTDDIRKEMAGELGPEFIETVVGRAEVKEVFPAGKKDKAAGLLVSDGVIKKGLHARLTRDDVIVSKTVIASLRRFKDDVAEVRAGMECGVVLEDTNDIKAGDMLEVFEVEERERTL
ncbi:translation initiation factor IF-2 [Sphingorhabdus soli]|uniref:Translation initiation factor IF-2 n=1 Tax=Flavisphingopyxis soli TaxID=2601267 RepID=A0A5C6U693_9SPHN|nr:translation initiation factor IF-2 [Sphingorhabdus soli]TXC68279.1 translation initiation factor IF-2 [Sphingorhabdus soli]